MKHLTRSGQSDVWQVRSIVTRTRNHRIFPLRRGFADRMLHEDHASLSFPREGCRGRRHLALFSAHHTISPVAIRRQTSPMVASSRRTASRQTISHGSGHEPDKLILVKADTLRGGRYRTALEESFECLRDESMGHPSHPLRPWHASGAPLAVLKKQARHPRRHDGLELAGVQMASRPFLPILDLGTLTGFRIGSRHARSAFHKHGDNPVLASEDDIGDLPRGRNAQRLCGERFEIQRLHESTVPRSPKAITPPRKMPQRHFLSQK